MMMSHETSDINIVSKVMSKALHLSKTNAYFSTLYRSRALVLEFLSSVFSSFKHIPVGSFAEGTQTEDSDIDHMIVLPDIVVCNNDTYAENVKGHVFVLDDSTSHPGYVQLKLSKLEYTEDQSQIFDRLKIDIHQAFENLKDGVFLSSEKFINLLVSNRTFTNVKSSATLSPHGPCITTSLNDNTQVNRKTRDIDMSHVITIDTWPLQTKEWFSRERKHNWPTNAIIKKISKLKCHVAPIGDIRSMSRSTEWRLSYLLGERELIWSFNDTQIQCYVILKKLLKKFIDPLVPDELSSYHMKNIVFWMSEEKGLSVWHDENLLHFVTECLNMLSCCIQAGELQNYFQKNTNLFQYKLEREHERKSVLQCIVDIRHNLISYVLKCMPDWPNLLYIWDECDGNISNFMKISKTVSDLCEDYEQTKLITDEMNYHIILYSILVSVTTDYQNLENTLPQLKAIIEHPPDDVDSNFGEMTKRVLLLRVGMQLYTRSKATEISLEDDLTAWVAEILISSDIQIDQNTSTDISADPERQQEIAQILITIGSRMDVISSGLYLASLCISCGEFVASNAIILAHLTQECRLGYAGSCSINNCIEMIDGKVKQLNYVPIYTSRSEHKVIPSFDIVFSSHDVHCVPYAVKFECALQCQSLIDAVEIHPCVYTYYLLCVGHFHIGNISEFKNCLQMLELNVRDTYGSYLRYRGLNLLGHCYTLNNDIDKAVQCYGESLKETSQIDNLVNAAAYHILIYLCLRDCRPNVEVLYSRT